jgi:hypothetical protein
MGGGFDGGLFDAEARRRGDRRGDYKRKAWSDYYLPGKYQYSREAGV